MNAITTQSIDEALETVLLKTRDLIGHVVELQRIICTAPTNGTAHLDAPRMVTNVAKLAPELQAPLLPRDKPPPKHMTQAEVMAIGALLRAGMPVSKIIRRYPYTRAAIYGLRDRLGLNTHRGSAALLAGIRRRDHV